jgi:hypothetical protein
MDDPKAARLPWPKTEVFLIEQSKGMSDKNVAPESWIWKAHKDVPAAPTRPDWSY